MPDILTQLPPSAIAAGHHCRRRAWLWSRDIRHDEDRSRARWFDTRDLLGVGWLYEVKLPSGARLDAWNPDEYVAVEFKAGIPLDGDVIQCHLLLHELHAVGVSDPQMQVWYRAEHRRLVLTMADSFGFAWQDTHSGWIAMRIEPLDETGLDQVAHLCRDMQSAVNRFKSPDLPGDHRKCDTCGYHDYCHI
jgi:hypothetical protein